MRRDFVLYYLILQNWEGKPMKKNGWKNLLLASLVSSSLFFGSTVEAGVVTDRLPLNCYADHQVNTYNSPGASKRAGYISANVDLIQITQVRGDGWCYGSYPGAKGKRVSRWFRITDVCADAGYTNRSANVKGKQTVYRTRSGGTTIGSVSNNEGVIVVADNGSRAQIVYRLDNGSGYKLGWVPSSSVAVPIQSHNPEGAFDIGVSNKANNLTVQGWAFDRDNVNEKLRIHVYIGGGAGSGSEGHEIVANKRRADVQTGFAQRDGINVGEYHGFDETISTNRTGRQEVYIYAINVGGGQNIELGHKTVDIKSSRKGDVNGDGKIDNEDARLAIKMMSGNAPYNSAADIDDDGKVTLSDFASIRQMIDDVPIPSPVQEQDGYIKTNGARLNFRTTPNGAIIDKINNGTAIKVLAHNNPNGWSKIRYNGQEGYVSSQYVSPVPPVPISPVSKKLQQLANNTNGYRMGTRYTGSGQCRGFANMVYLATFQGVQYISGYTNSNYSAASIAGSHEIGRLFNFGVGSTNEVKALFMKARPGAFVQMGRRYTLNSTRTAPSPHSAILYSVSDTGVQFYEANTDGKNTIKVNTYSWAELAQKNKGFTIYEPNSYVLK